MGLIDLKTDLKSLKYGNDKRGGGSSNQPYNTVPIPEGLSSSSPDFLLRNGYLNPIDSLNDVSRLTKWFTDTKSINGILFTAKQQLLERQNVKIPGGFNRIYNPAGTIAQAGILSTGYHLNKQGLNPFARGYFNGGEEGYYKTTLNDNEVDVNRLYGLYKLKQISLNDNSGENVLLRNTYDISSNPLNILSYGGGPNSVLGIGNTNIRFTGTGERERTNNDIIVKDALKLITKNPNASSNTIDTISIPFNVGGDINITTPNVIGISDINNMPAVKNNGSTTLGSLNNAYNPRISKEGIGIPGNFNREETYLTGVTEYKPLTKITNPNKSYENRIDEQNNLEPQSENNSAYDDLIKFYFELINNDNKSSSFLFFRAYLNNLGDNFKADWQSYRYVGRGENFYKYTGFSRDISLSFTIYAHSRVEMIPIYKKLNELVGVTAPSYSKPGLMRGNFIRMTVGDYLLDVPSIIQSINLKPSFEAGWDINREENGESIKLNSDDYVGQLPRLIEVDLSFTPIHNFTPTNENIYIGNQDII